MNENINRSFLGIWVPREIWIHPTLSLQAKCLWAEIQSLNSEEHGGCYASDAYLSGFLGIGLARIQEVLKELRDEGLIENISFNGRRRIMKAVIPKELKNKKIERRSPENRGAIPRKTGEPYKDKRKEKNKEKNKTKKIPTSSAGRLEIFLLAEIKKIKPNFVITAKKQEAWGKYFEDLLQHRTEDEIKEVILWMLSNDFWKSKALDPKTILKNIDQIEMAKDAASLSVPERGRRNQNLLTGLEKKIGLREGINIGEGYIEFTRGQAFLRIEVNDKEFIEKINKNLIAWKIKV